MKPTVSRIVHYVTSPLDGTYEHKAGTHRPAIIVHMWTDEMVQLQVFTDGTNDRADGLPVVWVTSVHQDESEDKQMRTWHWPEGDA
jgi:hypothetical protein